MVTARAVASNPAGHRVAVVLVLLGAIAAAAGIAVFRPTFSPRQMDAFRNSVAREAGNAAADLKAAGATVAQLFESRSPGERIVGALASLKPKRQPALHQRALPKIRRPVASVTLAVPPAAVPVAAAPVAATPLYNIVTGIPPVAVPISAPPPGAPTVVGPVTIVPGGGGGVIVPPIVSQPPPVTPPITPPLNPPVAPPLAPPETPAVPEPSSWVMMLFGFAMIGTVRHRANDRLQPV